MGRYILFFLCISIMSGARASADPQDIATTNAPIFYAQMKDGGNVTIHTWDRPEIQVDADPGVIVNHLPQQAVERRLPMITSFNFWNQTAPTPEGRISLPREPFDIPPLDARPHDGVAVRGGGNVTVNIPSGTALIVVNTSHGVVSIDNYHSGTIVSHIGAGSLRLQNVSGTVGAEINRGPFVAQDSQFDRIRVRNARGAVNFENCTSRQIEVSTLLGPIVYNRGSFNPGLARFESQRGDIALGVARGGAQVDAHSGTGHVYTDGSVRGGPVVTATSQRGNVMYYSGSVRNRANVPQPRRRLRPRPFPTRRP